MSEPINLAAWRLKEQRFDGDEVEDWKADLFCCPKCDNPWMDVQAVIHDKVSMAIVGWSPPMICRECGEVIHP